MCKINILREISLIHAVKCCKTSSDIVAINSFTTLLELKQILEEETKYQKLKEKISAWKNQEPVVTDIEIISLQKND